MKFSEEDKKNIFVKGLLFCDGVAKGFCSLPGERGFKGKRGE